MTNQKVGKSRKFFECIFCNYITSRIDNYKKHLQTKKHKFNENTKNDEQKVGKVGNFQLETNSYICNCGKQYKHMSSLWNHKQKCYYINKDEICNKDIDLKNMFLTLVNENRELHNMMIEQQKTMEKQNKTMEKQQKTITELIPKISNTTNNNQKFNINVFLNEKCRDAINIADFIKSIKISIEQLDTIKTTGIAQGLSSAIMTNLSSLSVYERPIHCTDIKRETLYIRDDNQWECDRDKTRIKTAIKQIAGKPYVPLQEWIAQNPDFKEVDEKQDYVANVLSTIGKPTDNIDKKIIKNVCASTLIK